MSPSTSDGPLVVGLDLGGTKVRGAIADLGGVVLAECVEPTAVAGGAAVVRQLAQMAHALAERAGRDPADLIAVAVGSPGVLDSEGRFTLSANISGLADVPLASALTELLAVPVIADNDVNVAALGEGWQGAARGMSSFAVLSVGTGLGLGIVVHGELLRGAHGSAGEIAFLPIGGDPSSPESLEHGTLEVASATAGLHRAVAASLATGVPTDLAADDDVPAIFAAWRRGDKVAADILGHEARLLAQAALSVSVLIDPEAIVLTGGIGADADLVALVQQELDSIAPHPVTLVPSPLGARSGVVGALAAALASLSGSVVGIRA